MFKELKAFFTRQNLVKNDDLKPLQRQSKSNARTRKAHNFFYLMFKHVDICVEKDILLFFYHDVLAILDLTLSFCLRAPLRKLILFW